MVIEMLNVTKKTMANLESKINTLGEAERVTKQMLGELSRVLLEVYLATGDVCLINKLLGLREDGKFVLTPLNFKLAVQYFDYYIPHSNNKEELGDYLKGKGDRVPFVFGKASKNKQKRKEGLIEEWLAVETNDFWKWAKKASVDPVPVDYGKKVISSVKSALDPEKGNMQVTDLIGLLTQVEGVSIQELMVALEQAK
jgi:hypothetical protein